MVDVKIMNQLKDLEKEMYACAVQLRYEKDEDMVAAVKADLSRYEYQYKGCIIDMNDDEKQELDAYAKEQGVELPSLFTLAFQEEEKEDYRDFLEMIGNN